MAHVKDLVHFFPTSAALFLNQFKKWWRGEEIIFYYVHIIYKMKYFGLRSARNVALIALLLAEVGAFVMYFSETITAPVLLGQVLAYEITSLFIKKSSPKKPDLYFSFGVEGTSILLFLSVAIFTYFWP